MELGTKKFNDSAMEMFDGKPKQQTAVEWLVQLYLQTNKIDNFDLEVAKEMEKQQQVYSEEDMAESFMACWKANVPEGFECKLSFKEWFEQFKKK